MKPSYVIYALVIGSYNTNELKARSDIMTGSRFMGSMEKQDFEVPESIDGIEAVVIHGAYHEKGSVSQELWGEQVRGLIAYLPEHETIKLAELTFQEA